MRKKSHTLFFFMLVVIYTLTNVGVPVYYHYCGGELEKVSALVKAGSCCGNEEDEATDSCCKNEVKHASFHAEFSTAPKLDPDFSLSFASLFTQFLSIPGFHEAPAVAQLRVQYGYHPPNTSGPESAATTVFRI